jgi:hypothetical protein
MTAFEETTKILSELKTNVELARHVVIVGTLEYYKQGKGIVALISKTLEGARKRMLTTAYVPIDKVPEMTHHMNNLQDELIKTVNVYDPKHQIVVLVWIDTTFQFGVVDFDLKNAPKMPMEFEKFVRSMAKRKGCTTCGLMENLKSCKICRDVYYCSVECQKKAWPNHKVVCKGRSI